MRVVRRAVAGMVTGRQFRGRARVHGTDVHHRRLADREDEPHGEECAEHADQAGDQITTHSVENY